MQVQPDKKQQRRTPVSHYAQNKNTNQLSFNSRRWLRHSRTDSSLTVARKKFISSAVAKAKCDLRRTQCQRDCFVTCGVCVDFVRSVQIKCSLVELGLTKFLRSPPPPYACAVASYTVPLQEMSTRTWPSIRGPAIL